MEKEKEISSTLFTANKFHFVDHFSETVFGLAKVCKTESFKFQIGISHYSTLISLTIFMFN